MNVKARLKRNTIYNCSPKTNKYLNIMLIQNKSTKEFFCSDVTALDHDQVVLNETIHQIKLHRATHTCAYIQINAG